MLKKEINNLSNNRNIIYSALDGTMSIFAIISATYGISQNTKLSIIIGLINIITDSISGATSVYQSLSNPLLVIDLVALQKAIYSFFAFLFFSLIPFSFIFIVYIFDKDDKFTLDRNLFIKIVLLSLFALSIVAFIKGYLYVEERRQNEDKYNFHLQNKDVYMLVLKKTILFCSLGGITAFIFASYLRNLISKDMLGKHQI